MRCGHAIHVPCLNSYAETSVACPLCRKSIVEPNEFEAYFDQMVAETQMPEEYRDVKMTV